MLYTNFSGTMANHLTAFVGKKICIFDFTSRNQICVNYRRFIGDYQNRIMGYGWLRQVRVKPNSCKVHSTIYNLTQNCAPALWGREIYEDTTDYCNQWEERNELTKELPSCEMDQFRYRINA